MKHTSIIEVNALNDMVKNLFLWLIIAIVLVSVFSNFGPRHTSAEKISYSEFLKEVDQGLLTL